MDIDALGAKYSEDDHLGIPGGGDRGGNVRRLGRKHAGARDGRDLGIRQELPDRLGEGRRRVVGLHVCPAIDFEYRLQLGRHSASASGGAPPPRSTPAIAMSPPVARPCTIFSADGSGPPSSSTKYAF